MTVAIELNTPLADALNAAIQPKLHEYGWATGGADDAALSEYIILMLVNNKTQQEVGQELSTDLLGLDPNDPGLRDFCDWLFATVNSLGAQFAPLNAQNGAALDAAPDAAQGTLDTDHDMEMASTDGPTEINAPTGPKAMRNGSDRGGRGQRIMGQINRAMDRTHDSVLHRTRGNGGINTHSRAPPTGPRAGNGRLSRGGQNRAASIQHGLVNMNLPPSGMGGAMGAGMNGSMNGGMNGGMGAMPQWGMMPGQPPQNSVMDLLQQQQNMLQMLQQQVMAQNGNGGRSGGQQGRGRGSLMDRSNRGNGRGRGGHHNQNGHQAQPSETTAKESRGEDTDMAGREPPNPEDTVCRFNLSCANNACKFAHQSPAAPPGVTIDVSDVCSFGVACKNFKCTGRHPSPATKVVHQSEQDCKFYPHCQNPRCTFRHPSKPPCRNGADCKTEGCEFFHTTVMCKFKPCTNRYCTFKHEEGQRGSFPDKVWTADGSGSQHPSERKFADLSAEEEQVLPGSGGDDAMGGTGQTTVAG
ncbi:unnamed protein product [Discula destructiva]